jgi:hypothetical protein
VQVSTSEAIVAEAEEELSVFEDSQLLETGAVKRKRSAANNAKILLEEAASRSKRKRSAARPTNEEHDSCTCICAIYIYYMHMHIMIMIMIICIPRAPVYVPNSII